MVRSFLGKATAMALVLIAIGGAAEAASPQQELVEKAALTADKMINDPGLPSLRATLKQAKAVLIMPSLIKGGFILVAARSKETPGMATRSSSFCPA